MRAILNADNVVIGIVKGNTDQGIECDDSVQIGMMYIDSIFVNVAINPVIALEQAKTLAINIIAETVKSKRLSIAGTTDDAEIAGWSNKLRIAQAIIDKSASAQETAAFQAEVNARAKAGETLAIFTQKVITNAALFAQVVGVIDGLKRKGRDIIMSATTLEQIDIALPAIKAQIESI